jgi:hypothetical protein
MPTEKWRQKNQEDMRRYRREWYYRNKKISQENKKERVKMIKEWFQTMKTTLKCSKCPQNHIATLSFHHTDPIKKDIALANACDKGWSKKRILSEIEKCIVLCHNCHSILHWEERQ